MDNTIIEFLNLKAEEIESFHCSSLKHELVAELSLLRKPYVCPKCNQNSVKLKDTYLRKINHGLFIDRKCIVHYKQKRYKCSLCNHTFNEPCSLVQPHQKKSIASHLQLMELLKDPHLTFKKVAELLNLSTNTIISSFYDNLPEHTPVLPRVLCIDEVYLGRNASKKYVAVLLNFETNEIVDIIYGRTRNALHSYFQRFPKEALDNVKYLSSDMYEGYRFLNPHYFKNTKFCADSFHVIQMINTMFNQQLKQIMKQVDYGSIEYYLLKQKRFILLKNSNSINWYQQEYNHKLGYHVYLMKYRQLLFDIHPLIKEIYDLKEDYLQFNRLKDKDTITRLLEIMISKFYSHPNQDVSRVGRTMSKWKQEILNSFTWVNGQRISNGPIESRNNIIKLLIRNAAGYRNFDHLRRRIIYCINHKKRK